MADTATLNIVANEVRRQSIRLKIAQLEGSMNGHSVAVQALASANADDQRMMASAKAEMAAFEVGAGPGATSDFGQYSSVDQLLRAERFAGKSASIDYIKANPTGTESEAEDAWATAAITVTGLPALVVPVASYAALYRANLMAAGLTTEATWEAQRDWIITTPKDAIMGA